MSITIELFSIFHYYKLHCNEQPFTYLLLYSCVFSCSNKISKPQLVGHIQLVLYKQDFWKKICSITDGRGASAPRQQRPSHFNTGHWRGYAAFSHLQRFGWIFNLLSISSILWIPWLTLKNSLAPCLALFITLSFHTTPGNVIHFCSFNKRLYADGSLPLNMRSQPCPALWEHIAILITCQSSPLGDFPEPQTQHPFLLSPPRKVS